MFNLYIDERRIEDVTVLDLKGLIRITGRTRGLHKSIRSLLEEGKTRILLNLSQVTHIDSSGLDELVASCVTARNQGGEIKLLHLTEQMREVIITAKLSAPFDIYNNEYDAIAGFNRKLLRAVKPSPSLSNDDDAVTAMVHPPRKGPSFNHSDLILGTLFVWLAGPAALKVARSARPTSKHIFSFRIECLVVVRIARGFLAPSAIRAQSHRSYFRDQPGPQFPTVEKTFSRM